MMYNNFQQMNPGMMNQGMVYNNQIQQPLMTNGLSPEQIKELKKSSNVAAIPQVTQRELYASMCTHRDPAKNTFATVDNNDGTYTCTICGETFKPVNYSKEQVKEVTDEMIDILQTTKLNYLDMSPTAVAEYFKILPLLKRAPELYQQSLNVFAKYDNGALFNQQGNNNYFAMFSALTNPGMAMNGMPMQQQPMMYNQQQMAGMNAQMMQQQPMMYNQQMQGGANPFYAPNQMQQNMCAPNPIETPQQQQGQSAPSADKASVKTVMNA